MAGQRGMLKRKPNFMSEVLKYEQLLFGSASTAVNAYEKQKIWWRITSKVNATGRHHRDISEVKNRWRGLRRRANDKIARHRLQQRQAQPCAPHPKDCGGSTEPPSQPELGPQWCLHGVCHLDTPAPVPVEVAPLQEAPQ